MTVEQFTHMQTSDTEDYELVEGELVPMPGGTPIHAKVRSRLERLLAGYFEQYPTGDVFSEIDCQLPDETVRRPDLSLFLGERAKGFDLNRVPVPYAPDIAVEVLSPSESAVDLNRKVIEYLAGGCREVWLLDNANRELHVRTSGAIRLLGGNDLLESPLLPGFSHPLSDLFVTL